MTPVSSRLETRSSATTRSCGQPEDGHEDLDEADHILDAALWLTHIEDPVGTDWVSETSYGECLDPAQGDEVADWTEEPITADFGTGWRLAAD